MRPLTFTCFAVGSLDRAIYQYKAYAPEHEIWEYEGIPQEAQVEVSLSLVKDRVELGRMPFFTDLSLAGSSPYGRAFLPYRPWMEGGASDLRDPSSELHQTIVRTLGQAALDGANAILERAEREGWRPHLQVPNEGVDFDAVLVRMRSGRRLTLDRDRGVRAYFYDAGDGVWMKSAWQTHYGPRGETESYLHDERVEAPEVLRQLWSMTQEEIDAALSGL